jgi:hypothetical protein
MIYYLQNDNHCLHLLIIPTPLSGQTHNGAGETIVRRKIDNEMKMLKVSIYAAVAGLFLAVRPL